MAVAFATALFAQPVTRHWTVADGLPTGEVQQIIELPNGQMLVNCEGVFCLSAGSSFVSLPYDHTRAYRMEAFQRGYGHLWQGDSLLWLRDFYCLHLFDVRTRAFLYDIGAHKDLSNVSALAQGKTGSEVIDANLQAVVDSLGLSHYVTVATRDRKGGIWIGTWQNGIYYLPQGQRQVQIMGRDEAFGLMKGDVTDREGREWRCTSEGLVCNDHGTLLRFDRTNVEALPNDQISFVIQLADERFLLCCNHNRLGYFSPERRVYQPLEKQISTLSLHRYFGGALVLDGRWAAVYSQNGAFLLDTRADTLAPFPCFSQIERFSDKYNCLLADHSQRLWVGTQNGLFCLTSQQTAGYITCQRVEGLASNCIRSLVADSVGRIWAGTAFGISCITPPVDGTAPLAENYGPDDGIPAVSMVERAAGCSADGRLVFVHSSAGFAFRPEWLQIDTSPLTVVVTGYAVNGQSAVPDGRPLRMSHSQNYLTFQFSALNYAQPTHTHYRYRLAGLEADWQKRADADGASGQVEYRALPPGSYTFQVQARAGNGPWGPITEQSVTILPPWWLAWPMKILYVLLAGACLLGLMSYYLKRKRKALERENDERVNRLFELRDQARHQFAENTAIDPQKISANVEEETLMQRMLKAMDANMDNADYGVDQLARDVAVSRSALYEKLRTMLGISPADFIRGVRLKHAAQLLADTQLSIAEVAEHVGFSSPRVFSTNFKKMFGMLPSDYRAPKGST